MEERKKPPQTVAPNKAARNASIARTSRRAPPTVKNPSSIVSQQHHDQGHQGTRHDGDSRDAGSTNTARGAFGASTGAPTTSPVASSPSRQVLAPLGNSSLLSSSSSSNNNNGTTPSSSNEIFVPLPPPPPPPSPEHRHRGFTNAEEPSEQSPPPAVSTENDASLLEPTVVSSVGAHHILLLRQQQQQLQDTPPSPGSQADEYTRMLRNFNGLPHEPEPESTTTVSTTTSPTPAASSVPCLLEAEAKEDEEEGVDAVSLLSITAPFDCSPWTAETMAEVPPPTNEASPAVEGRSPIAGSSNDRNSNNNNSNLAGQGYEPASPSSPGISYLLQAPLKETPASFLSASAPPSLEDFELMRQALATPSSSADAAHRATLNGSGGSTNGDNAVTGSSDKEDSSDEDDGGGATLNSPARRNVGARNVGDESDSSDTSIHGRRAKIFRNLHIASSRKKTSLLNNIHIRCQPRNQPIPLKYWQ